MSLINPTCAKPTLLLLTGFLYDKRIWQLLCERLEQQFVFSFWDGRDIDATCLEALSDSLVVNLPETFYLCGWSMGGILALYIANRYPERVKGMLLIATNPCFVQKDNWPGVKSSDLLSLLNAFKQHPERAQQAFFSLQAHGVNAEKESLSRYRLKTPSARVLDFVFNKILTLNLVAMLQYLQMPIEFIFFRKDKLVPWQVSHHLGSHQKNALVIANTGHGSLVTSFDLIADKLRSMI